MMTADMDRLLTAPARGAVDPGGPERAGADPLPTPADRDPRPPDQQFVRRIVAGVLVGALTMFGVATLDTFAGATVPVLGSFAALPAAPAEPEVVEVPPPPSTPGTCLNWVRPDAADTAAVDCGRPHLFEQAGSVVLADQIVLPDDRVWRQLVTDRCTPVVLSYLSGKFDPAGRYRVGALKPSPAKWDQGDRELRCGLQSASRSGALFATTGLVAASDQSAVQEPGICLAIDGKTIGDPVDCSGPHAVEAVGVVDLGQKFPNEFPKVADQDAFLQPECGRIAGEYAGGPQVIADKKLTVYWDNLTEESWNAGTRKVNCNLAALLPDRSGFAPVTGPVRGDVLVGAEPAPPSAGAPEPGVPAPSGTAPVAPPPADGAVEPPVDAPAPGEPPPGPASPAGDPGPVDPDLPPAEPGY